MFKITIKNKEGVETHGGEFATVEEANAWLADQENDTYPFGYTNKDYVVIGPIDISTKKDKEKRLNKRLLKRELGGKVLDMISDINDQKSLSNQQILDIMNSFGVVASLLTQGSITTARSLIASMDLTNSVFTEQERVDVLEYIDRELLKIEGMQWMR